MIKSKYFYYIILILVIFITFFNFFILKPIFYTKEQKFFPRINVSKIEITESEIDQKIQELEENIKISSADLTKNVDLGIYYYLKGQKFYDKAINILDNAWRMGALDERIFYYLGNMYSFLKLYNFAIIEYRKFLNNHPDDLEVQIQLANTYYFAKKFDDAIMMYENIINTDKENVVAMTNLATIYFEKENYSEAQNLFLKVKEICNKKNIIEPKNVNLYIGKIYYLNKNYSLALEYFKNELDLYQEKNLEAQIYLAKTYFELKDDFNTQQYAKEVLKIIPDNKEMKFLLSKIKK